MEQWTIISILSGIILVGIMLMLFYVNNLGNAPAPINQDKKGRAVYLLDTRLPRFELNWRDLFNR